MNIMILNGDPSPAGSAFDRYLDSLGQAFAGRGHVVKRINLREKSIRPCKGCFNCWVKTPGLCVFHDDADEVGRSYVSSDFVVFASPLIMGFPSALLKNAMDRNIPVIHPFLEEVDGEVHHMKRYDRYPGIAYLLAREPDTDDEDIAIVSDIFRREAINLRSSIAFIAFTDTSPEEVADAAHVH